MSKHAEQAAHTIAGTLAEAERALAEAAQLRAQFKVQEQTVFRLEAKNAALHEQLMKAIRERDFYQRHSITLVTRLNAFSMLITQSMQEAKDAAYAPSLAVPDQSQLEDNFERAIEELMKGKEEPGDIPALVRRGPLVDEVGNQQAGKR
jgi:hypothetical protein